VRLFSYLVEKVPTAIVLINSLFIDLLELAEKVTPSLTPAKLVDNNPRMNLNNW
jgi:nitrous oxidase accessory protein